MGINFFNFRENIFNLKINDILYTYVLGNTQKIQNLNLNYFDFRICVELPILAQRSKLTYNCLPSKERKRIGGKKKVNPFKDGLLILFAMISLFFRK